ncbi:nucleotidyltransferase family protein [Paracoccus stylophorae]|uniref:Nucleotidyltransferase family protein n=1 Tax=Paracoccus stylophorae TaxID=659350 RepID=A0ABY7SXG3_9RHOB|nr:nucleotidyltransferase family protein [Paracoccus stylophorae]WCR11621.1 nucleotidyltransferase family protein [Paracoccus stylophorae]
MIRAGLLLAAGASRRFGADDKLLATLRGRPLIAHAADALRATPLDRRLAVIANPALTPHLDGFQVLHLQSAAQSDSLRAGLMALGRPDRVLIVLGDMPGVGADHLRRVLAAATDDRPSASRDHGPPMPPACFPAGWLDRLTSLTGDRGAGSLIRDLPDDALIDASGRLGDIDSADDLATWQGADP